MEVDWARPEIRLDVGDCARADFGHALLRVGLMEVQASAALLDVSDVVAGEEQVPAQEDDGVVLDGVHQGLRLNMWGLRAIDRERVLGELGAAHEDGSARLPGLADHPAPELDRQPENDGPEQGGGRDGPLIQPEALHACSKGLQQRPQPGPDPERQEEVSRDEKDDYVEDVVIGDEEHLHAPAGEQQQPSRQRGKNSLASPIPINAIENGAKIFSSTCQYIPAMNGMVSVGPLNMA